MSRQDIESIGALLPRHDALLTRKLRLPASFWRALLEAHEARADRPAQHQRAHAYQEMSCLDQPMQVPNEDLLLGDTKNRQDQRVDDADQAQSPQPAGASRYDSQNEQREAHEQTKEHMYIGEIRMGIRSHTQYQGDQSSDTGNNL